MFEFFLIALTTVLVACVALLIAGCRKLGSKK